MDDNLKIYHSLLLKWQRTINLVSPTTLDVAEARHFADSAQLIDYIPDNVQTICDIGSGAGFPGLVVAIMRPDIHVHLVESDVRKCAFLRDVSRETGAVNVTIHNNRIEDVIADISADVITSRALASLRSLITYVHPHHSQLLLLKGKNWQDEVHEARRKFTFDLTDYPSETDTHARILFVGNIAKI